MRLIAIALFGLLVIAVLVGCWFLADWIVPQSDIDKIDAIGKWAKEELERRNTQESIRGERTMTKELEPYLEKSNDYLEGYRDGITFIMNFFEKLKDIDFTELEKEVAEKKQAEPIRHGHWTEDCKCSECGAEAITEWNETGGAWVMTPFCPFCGAEMEGQNGEKTD